MIVGDDAAAQERACTAVSERPDALAAFGGDGLVHLAVQAGRRHRRAARHHRGHGNDIASALGLHRADHIAAARTVLRMRTRQVDAAHVRAGTAEELTMPGVVCCGFDSRVNERANRLTWPPGMARYLVAMAGELRSFRPIPFRVTFDGDEVVRARPCWSRWPTRTRTGPDARLPRREPPRRAADVAMIGAMSKREFLRVFPGVYRGRT